MQMFEKRRSSNSVYDVHPRRKSKETGLHRKVNISGRPLTAGIIIGVCLTVVTLVLQCVAFSTPHWKEISPNKHSLYIDGVDALIRTEILVYFNDVHRFTRQSYGLFHRCEYPVDNSSKATYGYDEALYGNFNQYYKKCTKNYLPSYADEQFNKCHSLQYYRFCSKASEKNFDIRNDYLLPTFDLPIKSHPHVESNPSCNCQYPIYVKACHVLAILSLIFLSFTAILFAVFPFLKLRRHHLKVKCFGVLSSLFSMIFILTNILVLLNHLEYETIDYLAAIEKHYRSAQIYKLSQDAKLSIDRFLSSVRIEIGYSTIISWVAFILSIVDGVLLMLTCKISTDQSYMEHPNLSTSIDTFAPASPVQHDSEEYKAITTPLTSSQNAADSQIVHPHPPPPTPSIPSIIVTSSDEQSKEHSSSLVSPTKHFHSSRVNFEDEV